VLSPAERETHNCSLFRATSLYDLYPCSLRGGLPIFDGAAVVAALADAGFEDVQVTGPTTPLGDPATTVGVGVAVPGGCVYGAVTPDAVTLDAGGPIADGGCLEMPTH